jgi:hypothetical protein
MPRNPNNPRRKFASDEERKQAARERQRERRAAHPERQRQYLKNFYEKNPMWRKERHLQRKYGLGLLDFNDILTLQGNCCAVCKSLTPGRKTRTGKDGEWVVDHCHSSGKIRGIICHPCNVALGMVDDNTETLRALVDYLEKNR